MLQAGQTAFADDHLNVALYWFKLSATWAPSLYQAEIIFCEAAGAVATLTVSLMLAMFTLRNQTVFSACTLHARLSALIIMAGSHESACPL